MTCDECGRTFDLLDADDAAEWAYGHDCEAPADRCPCAFCTCGNPEAREGNAHNAENLTA